MSAMLSTTVAALILIAGVATAQKSECKQQGGQWCAPSTNGNDAFGICAYTNQGQFCCGSHLVPDPTTCSEGEQCCVTPSQESASCCSVDKACCYNYYLGESDCIDPAAYNCCPRSVQGETGHVHCGKTCGSLGEQLCQSSYGTGMNCSWSMEDQLCYDKSKVTKCSNSTSGNHMFCQKGETCCLANTGFAACCASGIKCDPTYPTGCVPSHITCAMITDKTKCLANPDCDHCGNCYNKSDSSVLSCCRGKGGASSATCSSDAPFCCSAGNSSTGSATCCGTGDRCCVDYRMGAAANSSACTSQHCCPAHIQMSTGNVGCSKVCSAITNQQLCQDKKWNADCMWEAGLCFDKADPPCPADKAICTNKNGNVECCAAGEKCFSGTGCLPANITCDYFSNGKEGCQSIPDCYRCGGFSMNGKCVNVTAGQCCDSFACDDGKCCLNNPSGCCGAGSGSSVCCLYENSRCCATLSGESYCCKQSQSCGDGSTKTCSDVAPTKAPMAKP